MQSSTTVITHKKRGPAPTGKGTLIGVRLQPEMLDAIDEVMGLTGSVYRSRPEVIRDILKSWLTENGMLGER